MTPKKEKILLLTIYREGTNTIVHTTNDIKDYETIGILTTYLNALKKQKEADWELEE